MKEREINLKEVQLAVEKELYCGGFDVDTIHEMEACQKLALMIVPRHLNNLKYRLLLSDDYTTSEVEDAISRYFKVLVDDIVVIKIV